MTADLREGVALIEVVRNGVVESRHRASVVALSATGAVVASAGSVDTPVFPRSSLKPLQAVGMLRLGLDVDDEELTLVCASHSGQPEHVDVVRRMLARHGLTADDLDNTPGLPLHKPSANAAVASGAGKQALTQNCSGKHAGMLATCVVRQWPLSSYRSFDHPLQVELRATIDELCGERVAAVAVDGCGAPAFAVSLAGCARAFARLASPSPPTAGEARVAAAMRTHPHLLGGTGRDVTALVEGVPGLIAKDGAEGVYAAGLPVGGVAVKVDDGAARARTPLLATALAALGATGIEPFLTSPVLGHGEPVGEVRVTGW